MTPRSWVGNDGGPPEAARPRRKPSGAWSAQLPDSASFNIDDPDLAAAAAVGYEGDVPAIGCPGWIFVSAGRRKLPYSPSADVNQKDLRLPSPLGGILHGPSGDQSSFELPVAPKSNGASSPDRFSSRHHIHWGDGPRGRPRCGALWENVGLSCRHSVLVSVAAHRSSHRG